MFGLFENKPLLEESSSQWLFDAFGWALDNFDAEIFYRDTVLVLPNNQFFPGRVDSEQAMALLMLNQVKRYACISHWPTQVYDYRSCAVEPESVPQIEISGSLRDANASELPLVAHQPVLQIPYNPQQISNPEGMIATFAHTLAHHLGQMARQPPPGGPEFWPHVTEVLAIYLGFGLMFANSAYTFKGSCASCYNPNANRDAYLSELQSVYGLAIFAVLKELPDASVSSHLKSHLRGFYRKAVKQIKQRTDDIARLKQQAALAAG
ncbi:MAG: hypothetical protein H8E21_03555 [Gammaproteobacteria bacterium]|nr:hypothetical protein [Gammaproteobacteria bacterium]MBL6999315.1 hypothetical protein [Gammaproteobacteria bacterium]